MRSLPLPERLPIELSSQIRVGRYFAVQADTIAGYPQICGGREIAAPDYHLRRDGFPFWVLEYIVEGRGAVALAANAPVAIGAGSIFCYGPGIPHTIEAGGGAPLIKFFLALRSEMFPADWSRAGLGPAMVRTAVAADTLAPALEQLLAEAERHLAETPAVVHHLHQIFLIKLNASNNSGGATQEHGKLLQMVMEIIEQEFATIGTLQELAQRVGVTPEYLCRRCRSAGQLSPYQLLLHKKMTYAAHLLRNGPWQVQEVARAVGFTDPFHFTRAFKNVMGVPPSRLFPQP